MPQDDWDGTAVAVPGTAVTVTNAKGAVDAAPGFRAASGGATGPAPLLASRLVPAPLAEPVLVRPRLLRRLDEGTAGAVTLVSAPAGWGKTTLLGSWARAVEPAPAWVSVEAGDTGARLWSYLVAALRDPATALRDPGQPQPPGPPTPDAPPRPDQLELLAAALAARERPVLLVLDDLHRITDPAALTGLEFLLRHAGHRLRLLVGARTDLPPGLHRLRLSGELTTVGPDELAFTDDEVADLLTAHGVRLPAAVVPRLRERTGGWPAGLRFAALAVRDRPDPVRWVEQFGGDQPDVAGYLREEVLDPLDEAARDCLRRGAVADVFRADLVDALTGRSDAEPVLAALATTGGFVRRDDNGPPWYRCHPLLADLLRTELAGLTAEERRELHLRAAGWYTGHGRPAEALRHALAAGHWDRAAELLVTCWPELIPYDREGFGGPQPAAPPEEAVRRDPELGLAAAAERAHAGDPDAAAGQLRRAAGHAGSLPVPRRDRFRRLATALELTLARLAGDHDEVRRAAGRLLATRTPEGSADDPRTPGAVDDADVRATAGAALGLAALADGDLRAAAAEFGPALVAAREAGRPRTELLCASRSALLHAALGELRAAERVAREALDLPSCQGWSCRVDCGHGYLALALVALHRDLPDEAEAHLALAAPATGDDPDDAGPAAALGALCRAQLLRDRGDPAAGLRLLATAREALAGAGRDGARDGHAGAGRGGGRDGRAGAGRDGARELADWLSAAEADLRAAHGDLGTARELLAAGSRPPGEGAAAPAVALARIELRAGDPRAAGYALPDWDGPEAAAWPLPVRLDAGVLDAVLAWRAGDERRAGRLLERALELAEPDGHRRVFTRAEPGARDLLAAHLDSGTAHWPTVSDLLRAQEPTGRSGPAAGRVPEEPLTERELTILRYLQSILSNVEIAGELSLSVNTVKTHVRNIYRKLDATRRREAVRRARELRLI
ncbi:LuxR C-terminal-related transcriptional regulator [Micromonospora sp. RTGN7]|uniref:LuxR C-terminal-related transcriptional regulator n=1 Tax=Micromonospora sp. RTGN7 TaxID=3016526 RepID=UPI0029FF527D|nr:LuxR C-terminal-related transcriptional regulator [Micromonospora sp. RTGN7]